MSTPTIQLKLSQLTSDLAKGYTRLRSQDQGWGSIEEKYAMEAWEVERIFLHPALKDKQTKAFRFELVLDEEVGANLSEFAAEIKAPVQATPKPTPAPVSIVKVPAKEVETDFSALL